MNTNKALFVIFAIMVVIMLLWMFNCNQPKPQPIYSALDTAEAKIKMLELQYGHLELENQRNNERAQKAELALRERKVVYRSRVDTIYKQAPDTCQPYLASMQAECDTLMMKADSNIVAEKMRADTLQKTVEVVKEISAQKDTVISEVKAQTAEAKAEARKQRNGKIVSWIVGSALVLLSIIF